MDKVLDRVARLVKDAKFDRDFGDYDQALESLREAVELLRAEYDSLGEDSTETDVAYKERLRRELADCYGMEGGLYRRKAGKDADRDAMLCESEQMYLKGLEYEQDNSYNLTNSIVLPILRDPLNLDRQSGRIDQALEIVSGQVGEKGTRKDQWWAWADLGLLNLLAGRLGPALEAYAHFRRLGAISSDYESTVKVLDELRQRLKASHPQVSEALGEAIQYLEAHKPRA